LAVAEAFCTIVRGSADMMLAGATGSRVHPLRTLHVVLQEELAAANGNPAGLSRPFDLHRTGMVVGEGAGALVLEELEAARGRGAPILAEIAGYGSSIVLDRKGIAHRDQALRNAMLQALRTANMSPAEVGHVHAHGAGTRQGDIDEARALGTVFSPEGSVPVVAAKSYFGNLGAAGGVIELVTSLLALQHDRLFPVLNYETADPECPLNVVRCGSLSAGQSVLNVSVTPQGQASAVLVRTFS
jgi:3-oxoacyl-[acyl-carrier-protein] synthase II